MEHWLPLSMTTFTVIDLETTGTDPAMNEIIEIGAVKFRNGRETGRFETLVQPVSGGIPAKTTEITGITNAMLKDAPGPIAALHELADFVGEHPLLVAHSADFDLGTIHRQLDRLGLDHLKDRFDPGRTVCTLRLAEDLVPEVIENIRQVQKDRPDYLTLDGLRDHYGLTEDTRHRADSDARLTARLLYRLLKENPRLKTLRDLQNFSSSEMGQ